MRLADALIAAQDESDVLDLLHSAYKQATEEQHKPYRRMTALRLAEYATQTGDNATAYQFYKLAFDLFTQTPANTPRYADALLHYSQAALQSGNVTVARTIAERAVYAAESLGDTQRVERAKAALEAATNAPIESSSAPKPSVPATQASRPQTVPTSDAPAAKPQAIQAAPDPIVAPMPIIEDTGDEEDPITPLILEAQAQQERGNHSASLETLNKALEHDDITKAQRMNVHLLMAAAYRAQVQIEEAVEQQKSAYHIAKQTGERKASVQILTQLASDQRELGLLGDALRSINESLLLLSSIEDKRIRQATLTLAGALYGTQGDTASADAFFQEALTLTTDIGNPTLRAQSLLEYATMLIATNRIDDARQTIEQARPSATPQQIALVVGHLQAAQGNWTQALAQYETAYSNAEDRTAQLETDRARALVALGRYDEAGKRLRATLQQAREQRRLGTLIDVLLLQARLLTERGKTQAALDSLENVLKFASQAQSPRQRAQVYIARSQVHARMGDVEAAQADWEEAQQLIERHSMPPIQPDWLPQA
jgi:tetratricopeptide (TPR) repeat protein